MNIIGSNKVAVKSVDLGGSSFDLWTGGFVEFDAYWEDLKKASSGRFEFLADCLNLVPENGAVVDIGAGVGEFACAFVKRGYYVHLFDGDLNSLRIAEMNLELNEVRHRADFNLLDITNPVNDHSLSSSVKQAIEQGARNLESSDPRKVSSLDSLGLGIVDLIRINLPGREELALRGAQKTIEHLRPSLFFENVRHKDRHLLAVWANSAHYFLWKERDDRLFFVPVEMLSQGELVRKSNRALTDPAVDDVLLKEKEVKQLEVATLTLRQLAHARAGRITRLEAGVLERKAYTNQLEAQITDLQVQIAALEKKLEEQALSRQPESEKAVTLGQALTEEVERLRLDEAKLREDLTRLRRSQTYQAGVALREGLRSPTAFLRLPARLVSVRKKLKREGRPD